MKKTYKTAILTTIIFALSFIISTVAYSVVNPSIGDIRVVRYGFPLPWLKATTTLVPIPSPSQYIVLWRELVVSVAFYLVLSLTISLFVLKYAKRLGAAAPTEASVPARVLLVVLVAHPTRLVSTFVHEFLGHGLWARVVGADRVWVYVSWLGFGWCRWEPSLSGFGQVAAMAGGLVNTFIVGSVVLAFLYLSPGRGGFSLRFPLFWLGFWAMVTQASYLLLGGVAGYGDPLQLSLLTGVPLGVFVLLGFALFLLVYFVTSTLFLPEVSDLFPEYRQETLLFEFWLAMPIQVVFFMVSPGHALPLGLFFLLLAASVIPSLLSVPLFRLFNRLSGGMCSQVS